MTVTEIKGFQVLPLVLQGTNSTHYVYFKKHDMKSSDSTSLNTLFIFNLPICTDISIIKKFFQSVAIGATVESYTSSILTDYPEDIWVDLTKLTSDLDIEPQNNTVGEAKAKLPKNCGLVTFIDKPAFQLAFNNLKKLSTTSKTSEWPINTYGSSYFLKKYKSQILDPEQLSNSVSESLVEFDRAEKESIEDLQRQTQLVDEDGFTLVVGSHRKTKASIMGKQKLAATVELEKATGKMKKKEKEDFYRFQLRQRKKDEMNDLLRKFKLDQEKVRLMKEKKRFKPY